MASKIILAFDTSSSACSVALQQDGIITSIHEAAPMLQAKLILPMIQTLLDDCSLSLEQVDVIAYGCGPGSFTGSRIASSVAQGLGFAANCPLLPISSLAAIAQASFQAKQWSPTLVALDARVGEVYFAAYKMREEGCVELIGKELVGKPDELSLSIRPDACWYAVGDGWEKYGELLVTHLGFKPKDTDIRQLPTAEAVLNLANASLKSGVSLIKPFEATPVYLR